MITDPEGYAEALAELGPPPPVQETGAGEFGELEVEGVFETSTLNEEASISYVEEAQAPEEGMAE